MLRTTLQQALIVVDGFDALNNILIIIIIITIIFVKQITIIIMNSTSLSMTPTQYTVYRYYIKLPVIVQYPVNTSFLECFPI